jgi:hypothetical protein
MSVCSYSPFKGEYERNNQIIFAKVVVDKGKRQESTKWEAV